MPSTQIRKWEAVSASIILVLNTIILNPTKVIIYETGSSSVFNIVFCSILAILFGFFIGKVFSKFPEQDILDITKFTFGKTAYLIFCFIFTFYFLFLAGISVQSFVEDLKILYQKQLDLRLILLLFIISSCFAAQKGNQVIGKISALVAPLTCLGIFLIFVSMFHLFDWYRMFPIFGYGIQKTFCFGASNLYAFSSLAILLFLPPLLPPKTEFQKVIHITTIATAILLIFSITCMLLLLSFSFTSSVLSPMYLVVRSVEWGSFFESPEAIFTFIFILSMITFLAILLMLVLLILKKLGNLSNQACLALPVRRNCFGHLLNCKRYSDFKLFGRYHLSLFFFYPALPCLSGYFVFWLSEEKKKGTLTKHETIFYALYRFFAYPHSIIFCNLSLVWIFRSKKH